MEHTDMIVQEMPEIIMLDQMDSRWIDFIKGQEKATFFHHPSWINLLADCYGYLPFLVAILGPMGDIQAGLPMIEVKSHITGSRWKALPFTDHCIPLAKNESLNKTLINRLIALSRARGIPRMQINSEITEGEFAHDSGQMLHILELSSDVDGVFKKFHRTRVQQCIKQAQKANVEVHRAENRKDMETFYRLHLYNRRRLGTPVQPKRYFNQLWDTVIEPGHGFLLIAYKETTPISAGIFLPYQQTVIYKYGASNSEYLRLRPNHLLLWYAIQWACEQGYRWFDWGKTQTRNTGLRKFKEGWGTEESTLVYSTLAEDNSTALGLGSERVSDLFNQIIQKSPAWVCRVTGELLYKHFA